MDSGRSSLNGSTIAVALFLVGVAAYIALGRGRVGDDPGRPAIEQGLADMQSRGHESGNGPGLPSSDGGGPTASGNPAPGNLPPVDPVDPPEMRSALPATTLFAPNTAARTHFAGKLSFGADDRDYIEFNRAALRDLHVGSVLTLQMPDTGKQFRIRIEGVETHPNADKSWTGRVLGAGSESMPVVFTQGLDTSFGSIHTPDSVYSLEAEGRLGWIASVDRLRRHQDFSRSDVLIPDPADRDPVPSRE